MRASGAVRFRWSDFARAAAACAMLLAAPCAARAAPWQPAGIAPTAARLADVIAMAKRNEAAPAQRHERWIYTHGAQTIGVNVAVRDDDFRTTLVLDGLTYTSGRLDGVRWRGDGNGIAHSVMGDLQGDAIDVAPQAPFGIGWTDCMLAGEAHLPLATWVVETHREDEKPAFLYVDARNGTIVREVLRDGRHVITTSFDRFEPFGGRLRARHWHVDDGDADSALDVTVGAIEPGPVAAAEVALPERRVLTANVPATTVALPASFRNGRVNVDVSIDGGRAQPFALDTGSASITIDPHVVSRGEPKLEHAALDSLRAGPLEFEHVSTLTVPFWGNGILGYDFFFGHVVEIGYLHRRVRVLSADDARAVFADPKTVVLPISVDFGLPLAHAAFGPAESDGFALDTGSPHVYVMRSFAQRFSGEISAHWTPVGEPYVVRYLEGGIEVKPYRVASFTFGGASVSNLVVGAQIPTTLTDDLSIPFDAIIGTDVLANFDLYFDYDNGRLGLQR
jgi:hypothetical protein